jgi:hypothetical protein
MTDTQEKKDMLKAQARINNEINRIFSELFKEALNDLTAKPKRNSLEFKEIRALMKGIKTGAELYSAGIATLLKHLDLDKYLVDYTRDLRKQNDQGIFALIDSLSPPPPETQKGGHND